MRDLAREMLLLGMPLLTLFNPPSTMAAFPSLTRRISRASLAAVNALSGLLLCIAFQVMAAGLRDLLPGLSGA